MENTRPVAIVTGAGSGIGRATALALGREGLRVVLVGRRVEQLDQTLDDLPEESEGVSVPMDVSDPASGQQMVAAAIANFGRLDVLINNAAAAPLLAIDKSTPELIQQVYMTNAVGPACAIAAAWTVFKRQHAEDRMSPLGHCIVNVSTLGTDDPFPGFFVYAASKSPLNLMAKSCAKEGREIGVRAFAVAPGAVETPMLRAIFDTSTLPSANCLTPEMVAEEILACVTGERDLKNGQTLFMRKGATGGA
ncbi:MAG: SDR family oxidoreductase [Phycisphaerales bacterium]|nr:SDR family oxidoreductase [Phycisphaerales bacterium]